MIDYGLPPVTRYSGLTRIEYSNVPKIIGALISTGKATLHELQTVYGVGDAYDLLEIINVDSVNLWHREKRRTGN